MPDSKLVVYEIRLPAQNEYTIENAASFLSTISQSIRSPFLSKLLFRHDLLVSLEIVLSDGQIKFYIVTPKATSEYIKSQLLGQYPTALLATPKKDYLSQLVDPFYTTQLSLGRSYSYPLKSAKEYQLVDPLTSVLAPLSRSNSNSNLFIYQILLSPTNKKWQSSLIQTIQHGVLVDASKSQYAPHPDKLVFEQKISFPGIVAQINAITNNRELLETVTTSFGVYSNPKGNYIVAKPTNFVTHHTLTSSILNRQIRRRLSKQILNTEELSLLWHLPTVLTTLPNIAWGKTLYADPPENLPISDNLTEEERQKITFFAKTEFRNKETIFGIKDGPDRRRHTYIIGKSGTGKTTLIANMAIDDIRKGKGVAVVDPHGDLSKTILDYIPSSRVNDVCYFNPSDPDFIYPLNVLEVHDESQRELVASGVVSIFKKLYGNSWGPRLEHILRSTVLTLVYLPNTHLGNIIDMITNKNYREKVLPLLQNQTLLNFWKYEFEKMDDKLRMEAISPILNKVAQFLSATRIRNTVSQPKSKVLIQEIMDSGKILIADLSTGKLGEDNSSLLGAMLISQIQLCAMNRVHVDEEQRKDFYLYVDEFQNFATEAFIKILSEARKFRLNLIMANQYMSQLDITIQDAILGNVGTLLCYVVGSNDAAILTREFGKLFPPEDLVKIGKYQILGKISIDTQTQEPFYATALAPLTCKNQGQDKVIRVSQERWGKRNSDFDPIITPKPTSTPPPSTKPTPSTKN